MGKIRWLHISDLHFGYNRYLVQNMREELLSRIKTIEKIDYLFITGDLRYGKEEPDSYPEETVEFINGMKDALGLKKESVFIVPGNHDVTRKDNNLPVIIENEKNKYLQRYCKKNRRRTYRLLLKMKKTSIKLLMRKSARIPWIIFRENGLSFQSYMKVSAEKRSHPFIIALRRKWLISFI